MRLQIDEMEDGGDDFLAQKMLEKERIRDRRQTCTLTITVALLHGFGGGTERI